MMCGQGSFEGSVRRAFARLTREDLPRAAVERGWPVRAPEDFERLLLGHLSDGGAEGTPMPAQPVCLVDLVLAVELGERLLAGKLCCTRMSDRLGGTPCSASEADPIGALLAAFARKKKRLSS